MPAQTAAVREGFEWCGLQGLNWVPSQEIDDIADALCKYDIASAQEELLTYARDSSAGPLEVELAEHIDTARVTAARRLATGNASETVVQPGLTVEVKKKSVGRPRGPKT